MSFFLSLQNFIVISENIIKPFSLVQNVYLSAGVATGKATKISQNLCSSSLKNGCEVAYS